MRLLSAVLFFLIAGQLLAQTPRQVVHKGKTVNVYPYPINEYRLEITPYLKPLPDGPYIAYYEKRYFYRFSIWKIRKKKHYCDSTLIAAEFSLIKGRKEGECHFYQKNGNPAESGRYLQDEKEGKWNSYFLQDKKKTKPLLLSETNYSAGKKNGTETRYNEKGKILRITNFRNDKENGKQTTYFDNGEISSIIHYSDTSYNSNFDINHSAHIDKISFLFNLRKRYSNYLLDNLLKHGEFMCYHANGNKMFRAAFYYGKLMEFDTLFDLNGTPELVLRKTDQHLPDSAAHFELTIYNGPDPKTGKKSIKEIRRFLGDTQIEQTVFDANGDTLSYFLNPILAGQTEELFLFAKGKFYSKETHCYYYKPGHLVLSKSYHLGKTLTDFTLTGVNKKDSLLKIEKTYFDYGGQLKICKDEYYQFKPESHAKERINRIHNRLQNLKDLEDLPLIRYHEKYPDSALNQAERYYYNNQPLEGKVSFETSRKNYLHNSVKSKNSNTTFYTKQFRREHSLLQGNFTNGYKDSLWTLTGKGILMGRYNYKEGIEDGTQIEFDLKELSKTDRAYAKECGVQLHKKQAYYMKFLSEYQMGLADGEQIEFHYDGNILRYAQYKNGIKNGVYETYTENGKQIRILTYKEGKLDGEAKVSDYNDFENFDLRPSNNFVKAWFKNGVPDGKYVHYYNNHLLVEGQFKNGHLTDDWYFYGNGQDDKNIIRSVYVFSLTDSLNIAKDVLYTFEDNRYNVLEVNYLRPTQEINNQLRPADVKIFHPNGKKALVGHNGISGETGLWKIFDENETVILTMDYSFPKKVFSSNGTDSLTTYAYAEQFYSSGQKRCEGWVYGKTISYDCIAKMTIPEPLILIRNYWSPNGQQTVKEGNGFAVFYDASGKKTAEGELKASFEEGIWKYYNTEGQLISFGEMKNGKKEGKWYQGDLEGLHLEDMTCFDANDPEMLKKLEYNKKVIKISEITYKNGKITKSKFYELNLNEKELKK